MRLARYFTEAPLDNKCNIKYYLPHVTKIHFVLQLNAQVVEGNSEETVHHAVSFAAQNTYLGLPQMKVYNSINIRLQFRTFEQNGLIFFNAGKASDFIALELVNGRLYYILNLGYGPITIKDNTSDMVKLHFRLLLTTRHSCFSGCRAICQTTNGIQS